MPFGKFKHAKLWIGLKCCPDSAEPIMEDVLSCIDDADVYIDIVDFFSKDWKNHKKILTNTLYRLQEYSFYINLLKCEWIIKEAEWLGYWLNPWGLKMLKMTIDAIFCMDRPHNATD